MLQNQNIIQTNKPVCLHNNFPRDYVNLRKAIDSNNYLFLEITEQLGMTRLFSYRHSNPKGQNVRERFLYKKELFECNGF